MALTQAQLNSIAQQVAAIQKQVQAIAAQVPAAVAAKTTTTPTPTTTVKTTTVSTPASNVPTVSVPDVLANDPDFKSLSPDNQALAAYIVNKSTTGNKADAQALADALALATTQANTYWAEKLNIAKDALNTALGNINTDLVSTERDLMLRKSRIEEDLAINKNDYSIQEQADLAAQARNLDQQIQTTREAMAARGLSSSSIRNQAEERINQANEDIVSSTKRAYQNKIRDIEMQSARNIADIENQIADAVARAEQSKKSAVSTTEQYLGSSALSGLSNISPYLSGNITGTMMEEKTADILARQKALLSAQGLTI